MVIAKTIYGRIEQKIADYETVANFYERNRESRFQSKTGLKRILSEINLELDRGQSTKNLDKLSNLQERISRFV